jgi:glycosyltransferase involved in cell wall biosynthesis
MHGISKPFLLYIGVWRDHKNIPGLVKAFELLRKRGIDCQLVLGGNPDPRYPEVIAAVEDSTERDNIILPGFISEQDLPVLYSAAAVFVLPSFAEGFGLVAIEAAACGTPVAASESTSLPEVMGQAARYFDPRRPDAMADVIEPLLSDQKIRSEIIQAGITKAATYTWEACARQTLAAYQKASSKFA